VSDGDQTAKSRLGHAAARVYRDRDARAARTSALAQKALRKWLDDGEEVTVAIGGANADYLAATSRRRLFVVKKPYFGQLRASKRVCAFEVDNVTGIEVRTGALTGKIVVRAAGYGDVRTDKDVERADNAITLSRPFGAAQDAVRQMQALLSRQPTPTDTTLHAAEGHEGSIVSRLRDLAALHESGALSADEYAVAKAKLLGES
jgi:Short C-terminal domain